MPPNRASMRDIWSGRNCKRIRQNTKFSSPQIPRCCHRKLVRLVSPFDSRDTREALSGVSSENWTGEARLGGKDRDGGVATPPSPKSSVGERGFNIYQPPTPYTSSASPFVLSRHRQQSSPWQKITLHWLSALLKTQSSSSM